MAFYVTADNKTEEGSGRVDLKCDFSPINEFGLLRIFSLTKKEQNIYAALWLKLDLHFEARTPY